MKFSPVFLLILLIACTDEQTSKDDSTDTVHANAATSAFSNIGLVAGCYQRTSDGDTVTITFTLKDSIVSGTEVHKIKKGQLIHTYEFHGVISDSILSAYVSSNGKELYRNTHLIRKDSLLPSETLVIPGPGQNGLVEYSTDKAYIRVDCKD